jgi:pyruvate dehydrogenase E2 component (dihydrolipoamide acetyltransferase)
MAKVLDMPKLSPTMEEGVLQTWHKKEGDPIEIDDLLAEVETDKATMEFRAFDKGTLLKILVFPGATVRLGQPVAILGSPGEDISGLAAITAPAPAETRASAPAVKQTPPSRDAPAPTTPAPHAMVAPPVQRKPVDVLRRTEEIPETNGPRDPSRVLASPYVRKTARELGVDLATVRGTGEMGRILPSDLESAASRPMARAVPATLAPAAPPAAEPEARPLSQMRKTIARRLTESKQTIPHFYLTIDVAADALVRMREQINQELARDAPEGARPEKISLNDLLIKACAVALQRVPECNATFTPEAILVHKRIDVSVAVAIPDGLVTPVIRDADKKSVLVIAREMRDLAARAKQKKLRPEEMSGGTFSISNLGMFGIDAFAAVINPPEGAILAVGRTREEPVVRDGAVVAGKMLAMTLSCDHRVVDGAVGASFLAEFRALIEQPMRILTG